MFPYPSGKIHMDVKTTPSRRGPGDRGKLHTSMASMTAALLDALAAYRRVGRRQGKPKPPPNSPSSPKESPLPLRISRKPKPSLDSSSPSARNEYLDIWKRAGVTVACGTYSSAAPPSEAYSRASRSIAQAHSMIASLEGELILIRKAADIEQAHKDGKCGLILDFQNAIPFEDDLNRINQFEHLGVRMVQLLSLIHI